jgi:hypothetical protein
MTEKPYKSQFIKTKDFTRDSYGKLAMSCETDERRRMPTTSSRFTRVIARKRAFRYVTTFNGRLVRSVSMCMLARARARVPKAAYHARHFVNLFTVRFRRIQDEECR